MFDYRSVGAVPRTRIRRGAEHRYLPPGWPPAVLPPSEEDWLISATGYLLGECPPEYRQYPVLRRYPAALAWLANETIEGQLQVIAKALSEYRVACNKMPPHALPEIQSALQTEQAALLKRRRSVYLVREAIDGNHFIEPL